MAEETEPLVDPGVRAQAPLPTGEEDVGIDPALATLLAELGIHVGAPEPAASTPHGGGELPVPEVVGSAESIAATPTAEPAPSEFADFFAEEPERPEAAAPPIPAAPPPAPAAPEANAVAAEDSEGGVDRALVMDSLEQYIEESQAPPVPAASAVPAPASPPATKEPGPAAGTPAAAAPRAPRRSLFESESLFAEPSEGPSTTPAPAPEPVAAPPPETGVHRHVRQAKYIWRFFRLSGLRTPEMEAATRDLQLLFSATIGLVWLFIAYSTRHPVPMVFAAALLGIPVVVVIVRAARSLNA